MKYGGRMPICLAGAFAFWTVAKAAEHDTTSNPYQSIIDRNVFALKPPPLPPDPEPSKPPPVKITLTGITTILGNKRALMKSPAPPAKPGEQPKPEQSYILTVGQREGDIEVLDIDEVKGDVKIKNGGIEITLNIDKDGPKLPATPPPAVPVPGMPTPPGMVPGNVPGALHPAVPAAGAPNPGFTMPTRTLRLPPGGGANPAANQIPGAIGNPANVTPQSLVPGASYYPSSPPGQQKAWPPEQNQTRETQMIMMEAERQQFLQQGNHAAASLLPSTELTPALNNSQASGSSPATPGPTLPRPPGLPAIPHP